HRRSHHAHDVGGDDEDERQGRQDQLFRPVPHGFSRRGQGHGRADLEHRGGEDGEEADADDELGHGREHEADPGHPLVTTLPAVQGLIDAEADAQGRGDDGGQSHEDEGSPDPIAEECADRSSRRRGGSEVPTKSPPSQVKYRCQAGWSSPSCSFRAAMRSGVACWPRIALAASPGSSRVAPKTSRETAMRMNAEKSSRLPMTFPNMSDLSDPYAVESPTAQRTSCGVGNEPSDVFLEGVDLVGEAPHDVSAFVVEHLLQLVLQVPALLGLRNRAGLVEDLVELRVVPVGFVEGRFGQGTGDDLRHEVAGVPEVLGEMPLELAAAEDRGGVDLADLDPDSGVGGLLGEDLGGFDGSGLDGSSDELDVESVRITRLGEELLRFVQILFALRK